MPVTLELSEDVQARLTAEATRRGITVDDVVAELAATLPVGASVAPRRKLAFVGAGASKAGMTQQIEDLLAEGFGQG